MRTPKAPAGFVPVDSEEAREIGNDTWVNHATTDGDKWTYGNGLLGTVKCFKKRANAHVQLPPAVEWEEVWGWGVCSKTHKQIITKHGRPYDGGLPDEIMDTIVRALNEMEGRDG